MHPSLSNLVAVSFKTLLYKIIYSDILFISTVETQKAQLIHSISSSDSETTEITPSAPTNGHTNEILPSQPKVLTYPPIPKRLGTNSTQLPQELNIYKRKITEISSKDPLSPKLLQVLANRINKVPQKRPRPITLKSILPDPTKKPGKMIRTERIMGENHVIRGQIRTVEVDISTHPYFSKPTNEINKPIIAEEPRCDYVLKLQKAMTPFKNYKGSLSMAKIIVKAVNRNAKEVNKESDNPLDNYI